MNLARRLVPFLAETYDLPDAPVCEPAWPGVMNDVCVVGTHGGQYVVRARADARALSEFTVEAWCSTVAREAGLDTPRILHCGVEDGVSYSIQEAVAGDSGEHHRSDDLWRFLGTSARRIADIELTDAPEPLFSRFGSELDAAWRAHLAYHLEELTAEDPLIGLGAYVVGDITSLRALLSAIQGRVFRHGLVHGDLALRNLIVPAGGCPVVVDWGSAHTGPVPFTDVIHLLRNRDEHNNPTDIEIEAFVAGFGGDVDTVSQARDLRVLQCLDVARWALDHAPERVERAVADVRRAIAQQSQSQCRLD